LTKNERVFDPQLPAMLDVRNKVFLATHNQFLFSGESGGTDERLLSQSISWDRAVLLSLFAQPLSSSTLYPGFRIFLVPLARASSSREILRIDSMMSRTSLAHLTKDEPLAEIGTLLAEGLMRLHAAKSSGLTSGFGESSLHISPDQSGDAAAVGGGELYQRRPEGRAFAQAIAGRGVDL
jgi:hypothetical protein